MGTPAIDLAGRAAALSTGLYALGESCGHDQTSRDITNIAAELTLLSTTLWRLHEAMVTDSDAYTTAFNDDLNEITFELTLLFDEIDECCTEMQKSDTLTATTVGWFFKKGRVSRLQRHLEALKTTLIVMRTVLHHGKDYGMMNSPGRLAESQPHTMSEDRAILESVFARNRNAIMNLHNLDETPDHKHTSSMSSISDSKAATAVLPKTDQPESYSPGPHGRNLSVATGVENPPIPDVLPSKVAPKTTTDSLSRRFSKRGVRLGVHMSILDLGAHDTSVALRKKWIAQAHAQPRSGENEGRPMTTIEEVPTVADLNIEDKHASGDSVQPVGHATTPPRSDSHERVSKARRRANSLIASPVGKAVSRVIHRLSLSNVRGGDRVKGEEAEAKAEGSNSSGSGPGQAGNSGHGNGERVGIRERLSLYFRKPELTTPDYDEEFENGRM